MFHIHLRVYIIHTSAIYLHCVRVFQSILVFLKHHFEAAYYRSVLYYRGVIIIFHFSQLHKDDTVSHNASRRLVNDNSGSLLLPSFLNMVCVWCCRPLVLLQHLSHFKESKPTFNEHTIVKCTQKSLAHSLYAQKMKN